MYVLEHSCETVCPAGPSLFRAGSMWRGVGLGVRQARFWLLMSHVCVATITDLTSLGLINSHRKKSSHITFREVWVRMAKGEKCVQCSACRKPAMSQRC